MNEILPITFGLIVGLLMGTLTARRRLIAWLGASAALGVAATYLTGEWRISWAFLLVDIPLVAGTAVVAHLVARKTTLHLRAKYGQV
jgi:hypothetical protein